MCVCVCVGGGGGGEHDGVKSPNQLNIFPTPDPMFGTI